MKKIFIPVLALTVGACGFFDHNSSDYWLNYLRNYKNYPVEFYSAEDFGTSEQMTGSEEIAVHTFKRNVVVSANLGQRMVDSQTFKVNKFSKNRMVAQQEGDLSNTSNEIHINKGQNYIPVGLVKIDGKYYTLIRGDQFGTIILLDEDGYVQNIFGTLDGDYLLLARDYASINPEGLRIIPVDMVRTAVDAPKQNFEILYNGVNNNMIEFIYKNLDEAGNQQSQKYVVPYGQKFIDIQGVKMQITDVYPDRIEYMLLD